MIRLLLWLFRVRDINKIESNLKKYESKQQNTAV